MSKESSSFMDGKTWLAIALVMVFWFGWQSYLAKKYGANKSPAPLTTTAPAASEQAGAPAGAGTSQGSVRADAPVTTTQPSAMAKIEEKLLEFSDDTWSFKVSSHGMALKDVTLHKFTTRSGGPVVFGEGLPNGDFKTDVLGDDPELNFELTRDGNVLRGVAQKGNVRIEKNIQVESARYLFKVQTKIMGLDSSVKGLRTSMSELALPHQSSMFSPSTEAQSLYVAHGTTSFRHTLSGEEKGKISDDQVNVSLAALGSLYFTRAIFDESEIHPQYSGAYSATNLEKKTAIATANLDYLFPAGLGQAELNYSAFVGPKELSLLTSINPKMEGILDYWVVGSLAKPMLTLMKWLHEIVRNWGIAIILLTIIVRSLVLPLYISSFKSMKAMQKIQPQMASIKERYKDNPQQMNAEVMKLFRDNKVNPVGSCLPMLLQLPIFIALYRVLSQSIELYQAPFALWIHDLSIKDPYYVLPILMGISMFVQQKITPTTTADPAQQKVMLFMPVIFSFMMMSLPSGLTLYIFVSTLFGIIQQMIFMKDKSRQTVTARA